MIEKIYHVEYNLDGRISCIWDSTDANNHSRCTYRYYANRIEQHISVHNDGGYGNWSDNTTYTIPVESVPSANFDYANNPFKDFKWGLEHTCVSFVGDNHSTWFQHNLIKNGNDSFRYDYDSDNYPTFCWRTNASYYGNSQERKIYGITYYPSGGNGGGTGGNGGGNSYNGHDYVDLGLPSGTLWATCDVGGDTPEASGDNFAWGETSPKSSYSWNNYKYCNGGNRMLTKYCGNPAWGYNGFEDDLSILQPIDDAATVNWGNGWCTPSYAQWRELMNYTIVDIAESTLNSVSGYLITGPNGNSIFLPKRSVWWASDQWSSSGDCDCANYMRSEGSGSDSDSYRCYGHRIRPVRTTH